VTGHPGILVNRLASAQLGYRLFDGIASSDRRGLIQPFDEAPDCRIFLSTGAGGGGLNLQNGTMLVNADLPWDPAVLGQWIRRACGNFSPEFLDEPGRVLYNPLTFGDSRAERRPLIICGQSDRLRPAVGYDAQQGSKPKGSFYAGSACVCSAGRRLT